MTMYNVVLTEEQFTELKGFIETEWEGIAAELQTSIVAALRAAQPIQRKIWKPFTTLKDGGTYQDRAGREFTVGDLGKHVTYPFYDKDTEDSCILMCWTAKGKYDLLSGESSLDLILELQE